MTFPRKRPAQSVQTAAPGAVQVTEIERPVPGRRSCASTWSTPA